MRCRHHLTFGHFGFWGFTTAWHAAASLFAIFRTKHRQGRRGGWRALGIDPGRLRLRLHINIPYPATLMKTPGRIVAHRWPAYSNDAP